MPKYEYESTGFVQFIEGNYLINAARRSNKEIEEAEKTHQHYWIITVAYKPLSLPLGEGHILDRDNIAFPPVVGCFICEQNYSEEIAKRRCPGDPTK